MPRRLAGFTPVHLLVLVAVAELSIFRVAVPALRPKANAPIPTWFVGLENLGLFLLYFGTTLAVGVILVRAWDHFRTRRRGLPGHAERWFAKVLALCAMLAIVNVVITPSAGMSFVFHTAWAAAIAVIVTMAFLERKDLGVTLGVAAVALPLLFHYGAVFVGYLILDEDQLHDGSLIDTARDFGLLALVLSAMASPYALCPKPAIRAVTRIAPLAIALTFGVFAAMLVRFEYKAAIDLAHYFVGVDLGPGVSASDMGLYLLALATLSWTLSSAAIADSDARREVGLGLGLVILGGYGFAWPFHFLLSVVGLLVMVDAAPHLSEEETTRGIQPRTPSIDDDAWQAWVGQLAVALRAGDDDVKVVTVRAEDDSTQTVMVGQRHGVAFKARFGRLGRALVAIDVVAGREVPETMRATFTLFAKPHTPGEPHPSPPPAAPSVTLDDAPFMARFRVRGDAGAVTALLDDALRARSAAMLDGWLAWWHGASVRFRVYPAVGAPMDHPVPLSDLAVRGAGTVERMSGVIDLVTAIAARGLLAAMPEPMPEPEPAVLE